jgi:hypothetical protein
VQLALTVNEPPLENVWLIAPVELDPPVPSPKLHVKETVDPVGPAQLTEKFTGDPSRGLVGE